MQRITKVTCHYDDDACELVLSMRENNVLLVEGSITLVRALELEIAVARGMQQLIEAWTNEEMRGRDMPRRVEQSL